MIVRGISGWEDIRTLTGPAVDPQVSENVALLFRSNNIPPRSRRRPPSLGKRQTPLPVQQRAVHCAGRSGPTKLLRCPTTADQPVPAWPAVCRPSRPWPPATHSHGSAQRGFHCRRYPRRGTHRPRRRTDTSPHPQLVGSQYEQWRCAPGSVSEWYRSERGVEYRSVRRFGQAADHHRFSAE